METKFQLPYSVATTLRARQSKANDRFTSLSVKGLLSLGRISRLPTRGARWKLLRTRTDSLMLQKIKMKVNIYKATPANAFAIVENGLTVQIRDKDNKFPSDCKALIAN